MGRDWSSLAANSLSVCGSTGFILCCASNQRSLHDLNNLLTNVFQRYGVDVHSIQLASCFGQAQILMQPLREIVRHQLEPEARLNEVMVNGVHAHPAQALHELAQGMGYEGGWNHDDIGGAEIEGLSSAPRAGAWGATQEVLHDREKAFAQLSDRSELADVDAGQSFRQTGLIASE